MNKVSSYLQEHVAGEVVDSPKVRAYFSTDGSVLEVMPSMVVYPYNTNDMRKVARFTWQLAEKGHVLPITTRGLGSNQTGSAIGKGIVVVTAAHMNQLLELDAKQKLIRVQPGMNYGTLQAMLETHSLFLPPYPSDAASSTIGGAIAENASGEKSIKYGTTRQFVQSLEVVLANGELIQTERLSKRELNRRKGITNFEGEVYRQLDNLISDNWELLQAYAEQGGQYGSAGYALSEVKRKDGSFDLTPLFVGSQGTLGLISEAILKLEPYVAETTVLVAYFNSLESATAAVSELITLEPSALEMVDKNLLDFVMHNNPARLKGLVTEPFPAVIVLVEFDDEHKQQHKAKKAKKILANLSESFAAAENREERERLWSIRRSASEVATIHGDAEALPILANGTVPRDRLQELIEGLYALFAKHHLKIAIAGHAGIANLTVQPLLDLAKVSDRQKVFKLMDDYYDLVLNLGGDMSGDSSDGRLYGPYLPQAYGPELYQIFCDVKHIFDPYGTLNPGVKVEVSKESIVPMLRKEYSAGSFYDRLPNF